MGGGGGGGGGGGCTGPVYNCQRVVEGSGRPESETVPVSCVGYSDAFKQIPSED